GNSRLSKYYSQMRKRLEGVISRKEQGLKNATFRSLTYETPAITFDNKSFAGSFYKVHNQKFMFGGVDSHLLSFEGFLDFEEYSQHIDRTINGDHYILYKDGVLIIEINQIYNFTEDTDISAIKNYQE